MRRPDPTGSGLFLLEAETCAEGEAERVAEKSFVTNVEVRIERGSWIFQDSIGDVDPDERPRRRIDFNAAANLIRGQGVAAGERAVERWRKDRDARQRSRRSARLQESRGGFGEGTNAIEARAHRGAEQSFKAAAGERDPFRKVRWIPRQIRVDADQC